MKFISSLFSGLIILYWIGAVLSFGILMISLLIPVIETGDSIILTGQMLSFHRWAVIYLFVAGCIYAKLHYDKEEQQKKEELVSMRNERND